MICDLGLISYVDDGDELWLRRLWLVRSKVSVRIEQNFCQPSGNLLYSF
jgi:hypothetical protein